MLNKIIVLDFGSQYNQLIVRRVREMGVYAELKSYKTPLSELSDPSVKGIIMSGGPKSVYNEDAFKVDPKFFELDKPILGICYGMQLMAQTLGGKVSNDTDGEYGLAEVELLDTKNPLFKGLNKIETMWMSHGDSVDELPLNFDCIGRTDLTPITIMAHENKPLYGVQFHPEVVHSVHGKDLLKNFVLDICGVEADWTMENIIEASIKDVREKVGTDHVICGLSGGVDSSVVAMLLHKAIGDQLTCIFVDHGLLRKNEAENVVKMFKDEFNIKLIAVDAKKRFLDKLKGVSDPETKRKIIGAEFIEVFKDEASKIKDAKFLAQGTLYSDVIESGTETAKTIKSHHNVGGLPEQLGFKLVEPLRTLFKDEARAMGEALGLPHKMVHRQPFPGPGLAIRVMSDITEEKLEIVRESDAILHEEFEKHNLTSKVWQFFTVLTNNRSVGVMGDERTYDYTLAIRAVSSVDGMTARASDISITILEEIATRMINEVKGINRVVYDLTSKPPGTIEWE